MDIRTALKEQYHGGLEMLRQCIERCPEDLWDAGKFPRTYWRIAFHTIYFTHVYLGQNEDAFEPWPARRPGFDGMWQRPWDLEPYELPRDFPVHSQAEMLAYLRHVQDLVDPIVDSLNLDTAESGFPWYGSISKLSHQLMNVRHIQGHVGQLSELLMFRDIDIDWVSKGP